MRVEAFEALVDQASRAAAELRWTDAGSLWDQAATQARDAGAEDSAARCFEQAGECWRRADHALRAERSLQEALSGAEPPGDPVATCARLAAVLGERGRGGRALVVGRQALLMAERSGSPTLPVAVDTLVGLEQGFGSKEAQRMLLGALEKAVGDGPSVSFRRGQLARLDDELDDALRHLLAVEQALEGAPGAEAGVAGARMERAEVQLLLGETEGAVDAFVHARELHRGAGRDSLAWRCEVGRIRAAVRVGLEPVAPGLADAQRWAEGLGLDLLAVDLQVARALCAVARRPSEARELLTVAAQRAGTMGAGPRVGRIHLHLLTHIPADRATRAGWGRVAAEGLADNLPLLREVRRLLPEA